ncbi:hypothetical protein J2X83_003008 [Brevibacillus nitrificans]|nr:hypothetical protein [Brevibacillus nitrificans]
MNLEIIIDKILAGFILTTFPFVMIRFTLTVIAAKSAKRLPRQSHVLVIIVAMKLQSLLHPTL